MPGGEGGGLVRLDAGLFLKGEGGREGREKEESISVDS